VLSPFVARLSARLPENTPGDYFVDDSCIDCETCRILAPQVFARSTRRGLSIVSHQPGTREQELRARMAIVSCPTSAIGTSDKVDLHDAAALRFLRTRLGGGAKLGAAIKLGRKTVDKVSLGRRPGAGLAIRAARLAGVPIEDVLSGAWPKAGACPRCWCTRQGP